MEKCSPDQIAEKRRIALEKLKAKKLNTSTLTNSNNYPTNIKPVMHEIRNNAMIKEKNSLISKINNNSQLNMPGNSMPVKHKPTYTKPSSPYNRNQRPNVHQIQSIGAPTFFGVNEPITTTAYLISEDRFTIDAAKYFEPLITLLKSIPGRLYSREQKHVNNKQWNFLVKDYDLVMEKVQMLRPDIVVGTIPQYVLNCLRSSDRECLSTDLEQIEPTLLETLLPFQRDGVCFGIEKNGRCLIADEMGLGKTFQAMAIAHYYRSDWPLLIATTSSMRNNWEDKIHKYLPSIPLHYIQQMQSAKDYISESRILIVTYDLMTRCTDKLLEKSFGVLIMDESHTLKNFKAKCTKAALSLAKQAKRIVLLSGTPALSRPSELFTQICLIDSKCFPDFYEYSKRYCNGHTTRFGWDANGQSNLQELEIILYKKFMIRRTKEAVLELPNKTREIINLDESLLKLSEQDYKNLNLLASDMDTKKKGAEKHAAMLTFFGETAKLKVKAVCTYIHSLLEEKKKFLVFAHHQVMLNAICDMLSRKNVLHIRIDGKTNSEQRNFLVNRFNLENPYVCAILSITAANAGITLTAAELVIFAELHWNPSILTQAESRAHRIGQTNKVEVRYLLAKGTVDGYIWKLIQSKSEVLTDIGLTKDSFKDTSTRQQESGPSDIFNSQQSNIKNFFKQIPTQIVEDSNLCFEDCDDEALANIVIDI